GRGELGAARVSRLRGAHAGSRGANEGARRAGGTNRDPLSGTGAPAAGVRRSGPRPGLVPAQREGGARGGLTADVPRDDAGPAGTGEQRTARHRTATLMAQGPERPGFHPGRLHRLIIDALAQTRLRLERRTVLTEAASGAYVVTPVLAALAGARVQAFTRTTPYGTFDEVVAATRALAERAG